MTDIAIRVENLSKRYHIGRTKERHDTLRDALVAAVRAPLDRLCPGARPTDDDDDTIWALKDVSFEIKRGEVVGVIGRNGAGKSTLLKILSRITEPTSGRAEIHGRVGSLLEVGTGFHPELTGRENVYLSGAILGMRREEIDRKFDEIVDFSGVEKFIDMPVKRYSSGMYVRLAFSVAAHLDTEVLLVDEVLSVGDTVFQRKCLNKLDNLTSNGRTVALVSHNMQVISKFCGRALLLSSGEIAKDGIVSEVVSAYLGMNTDRISGVQDLKKDQHQRKGTGSSRFVGVSLEGSSDGGQSAFQVGEEFRVILNCRVNEPKLGQFYQIRIRTNAGVPVFHWVDFDDGFNAVHSSCLDKVEVKLDALMVFPGRYLVSLWVGDRYGITYDYAEDCIAFDVVPGSIIPMRRQYYPQFGLIHLVPKWKRLENHN